MDKYFDPKYDPRLDVSVSDLTAPNGLIADGGFDGWDRMLSVVRDRKEDKKLREQREKEERRRERDRSRREREDKRRKRRKKRDRGDSGSEDSREDSGGDDGGRPTSARDKVVGDGLMGVQYAKRGATREWDMGKNVD